MHPVSGWDMARACGCYMSIGAGFFCSFAEACGLKGEEECRECVSFYRHVLSLESLFGDAVPEAQLRLGDLSESD